MQTWGPFLERERQSKLLSGGRGQPGEQERGCGALLPRESSLLWWARLTPATKFRCQHPLTFSI